MAVLGVLTCAASALAGGGKVLPPDATPKGYSLEDMAVETAAYNVAFPAPEPLPDVPFEVVVSGDGDIPEYTVKPGTMLYLPIFNLDNSIAVEEQYPGLPPFPKDIHDQDEDADYLASAAEELYDVTAFIVQVDDKITVLCDDYTVGVKTEKLPDGGTEYIVASAFLTPLSPGVHTVGIGGIIEGEPVVFVSYTVTVKR